MNFPSYFPEFPNSRHDPFIEKSAIDPDYNCIAWAYGTDKKRLWPNLPHYYWPEGIPNEPTIEAFIQLFASIGYVECDNGDLENNYLKIAIYQKNGEPTHAARQLENGKWASKLGRYWDIHHSIFAMANGDYGDVVKYMKRRIKFEMFLRTTL